MTVPATIALASIVLLLVAGILNGGRLATTTLDLIERMTAVEDEGVDEE